MSDSKTIAISLDVWQALLVIKAKQNLPTLNDAIRFLDRDNAIYKVLKGFEKRGT